MANGEHLVQHVPAPWTLKAESYLLFLKFGELPKGVYDGLDATWEDEALGRFEGGLGAVMILRYTDTPVGRSSLLDSFSLFVVLVLASMCMVNLVQPRCRNHLHVESLTKRASPCPF
jgi:hypothetical protein